MYADPDTSLSGESAALVRMMGIRKFKNAQRKLIKEVKENIISRSPENSEIMSKAMDFCVRNS